MPFVLALDLRFWFPLDSNEHYGLTTTMGCYELLKPSQTFLIGFSVKLLGEFNRQWLRAGGTS